jgi:glycogen debranching enzyme
MDDDGLISAGSGFDQVTWMDVRVGDIVPTPRHGKPVEINASCIPHSWLQPRSHQN